mmetsp:Transcript_992/g.2829  ORF Transcript_992/g.2829 Transcript_992/m.2829 type:complete len:485 (+) Transcript_992:39-1493(+)
MTAVAAFGTASAPACGGTRAPSLRATSRGEARSKSATSRALHVGAARGSNFVVEKTGVRAVAEPGRLRPTMAARGSAEDEIAQWVGTNLDFGKVVPSAGRRGSASSWASSSVLSTESGTDLFVKTSYGPKAHPMFRGELLGLRAMRATGTVYVPEAFHAAPFSAGDSNGAYIVMEHLSLGGRLDQAQLGEQLAKMHLAEPLAENAKSGKFGFDVENTIGGTPQPNEWLDDWIEFLVERRLLHQARLTKDMQLQQLTSKLCARLREGEFFEDVMSSGGVKPSTLHGDLWSGNAGALSDGRAVIFDPATYYGHHEAEFGMSWCAGFSRSFWDAYHRIIPRAPGFAKRHQIYTLYHVRLRLVCILRLRRSAQRTSLRSNCGTESEVAAAMFFFFPCARNLREQPPYSIWYVCEHSLTSSLTISLSMFLLVSVSASVSLPRCLSFLCSLLLVLSPSSNHQVVLPAAEARNVWPSVKFFMQAHLGKTLD